MVAKESVFGSTAISSDRRATASALFEDGLRAGDDAGDVRIFAGLSGRALVALGLALVTLGSFVLLFFLAGLFFEAFVE